MVVLHGWMQHRRLALQKQIAFQYSLLFPPLIYQEKKFIFMLINIDLNFIYISEVVIIHSRTAYTVKNNCVVIKRQKNLVKGHLGVLRVIIFRHVIYYSSGSSFSVNSTHTNLFFYSNVNYNPSVAKSKVKEI